MRFTFTIEVEVDARFVSRESVKDELQEALEGANPDSMYIDDKECNVDTWDVSEVEQGKPKRENKATVKDSVLNEAFKGGANSTANPAQLTPLDAPEWSRD